MGTGNILFQLHIGNSALTKNLKDQRLFILEGSEWTDLNSTVNIKQLQISENLKYDSAECNKWLSACAKNTKPFPNIYEKIHSGALM